MGQYQDQPDATKINDTGNLNLHDERATNTNKSYNTSTNINYNEHYAHIRKHMTLARLSFASINWGVQ
jgi:hypothetical protein